LEGLRDRFARARILKRIDRLAQGNPSKWRSVGDGVIEMKIDYGPGYRVYYVSRGTSSWCFLWAAIRVLKKEISGKQRNSLRTSMKRS
jgi:putative addiction module killer protein